MLALMAAPFWRLDHLSDQQLLERLQSVLHTKRRALAELIAHLAEVEERRLHLQAAYGSLFSYCVQRLGMSEDEACRRIELARLGRRFPVLFEELASGSLTLSVALLLKRALTPDNHLELIAAVRGASSQRASEILAEHFPRPDASSRIRKLPGPAVACATASAAPEFSSQTTSSGTSHPLPNTKQASLPQPLPQPLPPQRSLRTPQPPLPPEAPHSRARQHIEPLSAGRYRVQFTADASLKRKLEQARDLLRHAEPSGDFAAIVSRALDSLLEELMKRRFGARHQERNATPSHPRRPL